jgi:hypothetical protein
MILRACESWEILLTILTWEGEWDTMLFLIDEERLERRALR